MNRINFKNINTKSVDQSYFKPKVNVKVKKEVEDKPKYQPGNRKYEEFDRYDYDFYISYYPTENKVETKLGENINNLEVVTKVEKPKEEITKTLIDNNKRSYQDRGYYGWHGHCKYTLNNCEIRISDNVGGCGVQQLYNWGNHANNVNIPKLLKHVLNDLSYGVGIVLCQVGSMFYESLLCKTLEELGFKYHEEYKNHQHGGRDTGRIYTLIINKNEKN